jgi:hypothetical protein
MFFTFFGRLTISKAQVLALSIAALCVVLAVVVAVIGSQPTHQASSLSISTTSQPTYQMFSPSISFSTTLKVAKLATEGKVATEHGTILIGHPDMQSRNGIFKYFGFSNEWQGIFHGVKLDAFAGARNSFEPSGSTVKDGTGALIIFGHIDNGTDDGINKGGTYFAPGDLGSLRITDEVGGILVLQTADGLSLHFDLDSWRWVNQ